VLARQHAVSGSEGTSPAKLAPATRNGNSAIPSAFMPQDYVKTGEPIED
jgi:hypothetical protein